MPSIELSPDEYVDITPIGPEIVDKVLAEPSAEELDSPEFYPMPEQLPESEPFRPSCEARKITDVELLKEIIGFILDKESTMTLEKIYRTRHSPLRTQLFLLKLNITTEVSVHLVRHAAVGQFHYVSSHRQDWGDYEPEGVHRLTPVRHVMLLNAEHLIEMANARLCTKALLSTRQVMEMICTAIQQIDPALGVRLVPKCFHQGGLCYEDNPCGRNLIMLRQVVEQIPEQVYRDWRNQFIIDNYRG